MSFPIQFRSIVPVSIFLFACAILPLRGEEQQPISPALAGALRKSGLPKAAESVSIPLEFTYKGFTVELHIDGKPVQLILDTGAASTVLSPEVARKLGLETQQGKDIMRSTTGGQVVNRRALTKRLSLGDAWTENEPVLVSDIPAGMGINVNLLRHYVMTFRFAAGELRLKPIGTVQEITRTSTVGINLDLDDKILSVVPDGSADKAWLRAGDELLEIEGHPLKTMKPEEFATFKRLPPGSTVKVRYRRGVANPVEVRLVLVKE